MIYYSLESSPYTFKIRDFIFYFSSSLTRLKFISKYEEYLKERTNRLQSYYKCKCDFSEMLLISLYKRIECRGCYILYKGKLLQEYSFSLKMEV